MVMGAIHPAMRSRDLECWRLGGRHPRTWFVREIEAARVASRRFHMLGETRRRAYGMQGTHCTRHGYGQDRRGGFDPTVLPFCCCLWTPSIPSTGRRPGARRRCPTCWLFQGTSRKGQGETVDRNEEEEAKPRQNEQM
jgi:hypothetical protein